MLLPAYNANLAGPFRLLELPEPDRLHAVLRTALFDQDWGVVGVGAACQSTPKSAPIRRFVADEERAVLASQVSLRGG
jgi:hypothetical protein